MKYKVIKTVSQYETYCNTLHELVKNPLTRNTDEVELLTLLIEKWDSDNLKFKRLDPIEYVKLLMKENNVNASELGQVLQLSKATISKMLNYQKGLSKETIRLLSAHFNVHQEIFNQPYTLKNSTTHLEKGASSGLNKSKTSRKEKHPV
jgi:HTH-type transcriptional regulator/antitoxin HigA